MICERIQTQCACYAFALLPLIASAGQEHRCDELTDYAAAVVAGPPEDALSIAAAGRWPDFVYEHVERFISEREINSPEEAAARVAIRCRLQTWWVLL